MALRRQLAAQDAVLEPILNLIPTTATDEQIYFYIWTLEDSIANRVPVPAYFNPKCVDVLRNWITEKDPRDFAAIPKLRPLTYKTIHFQDLFKFASNRKNIFTRDAITKIEGMLDCSIPNILCYFLDKLKSYPVYQQYAIAISYFLHIDGSFRNTNTFLNFICDGPSPPGGRANWNAWKATPCIAASLSPTDTEAHPKDPVPVHEIKNRAHWNARKTTPQLVASLFPTLKAAPPTVREIEAPKSQQPILPPPPLRKRRNRPPSTVGVRVRKGTVTPSLRVRSNPDIYEQVSTSVPMIPPKSEIEDTINFSILQLKFTKNESGENNS